MAIAITERPHDISWSKNQIRYGMITSTPAATPGLYIRVSVLFSKFDETLFYNVVTLSLLPDLYGNCYVDIANILDGLLSWYVPDPSDAAPQKALSQCGKFFIRYSEVTDADPDPETTDDHTLIVVKGGISYEQWKTSNFFTSYIPKNKPFLTWQPSGFLMGKKDNVFLSFLQMAEASGNIVVHFDLHYADGSEAGKDITAGSGDKYSLWCVPAGIEQAQLNEPNPAKFLVWYEVSVSDDSGMMVNPYRIDVDHRNFYDLFQFNYINSLGGIDSVRVLGQWDQTQERSFDSLESLDPAYFMDNKTTPAQIRQENIFESITYKGNSGPIYDGKTLDAFRDLMLSAMVLHRVNDRWIYLLMTATKTSLNFNRMGIRSLALEWRYSFNNSVYTPLDAAIGAPVVPACPVPLNLRVAGQDGSVYHLTFDTDEGQVSFQPQFTGYTKGHYVTLPGGQQIWKDGQYVGDTPMPVITTNTFDFDMADYTWVRIKVKADCGGSQSGFSNQITLP